MGPQICHGLGRVWGNSCVNQVQIDRNQTHPLPNPLMHPSWTIKDFFKNVREKVEGRDMQKLQSTNGRDPMPSKHQL